MNTLSHMKIEWACDYDELRWLAQKWQRIHGRRTKVYVWPRKMEVWLGFDGQPPLLPRRARLRESEAVEVEVYLMGQGL